MLPSAEDSGGLMTRRTGDSGLGLALGGLTLGEEGEEAGEVGELVARGRRGAETAPVEEAEAQMRRSDHPCRELLTRTFADE